MWIRVSFPRLRWHPQQKPHKHTVGDIIELIYENQRRKLWPDAKARLVAKLGDIPFDYSPAAVQEIECAVRQEQNWDWD